MFILSYIKKVGVMSYININNATKEELEIVPTEILVMINTLKNQRKLREIYKNKLSDDADIKD